MSKEVKSRSNVAIRLNGLFALLVLGMIIIQVQVWRLIYIKGPAYSQVQDSLYIKKDTIVPQRGNILAEDGSFLATSIPTFNIHICFGATKYAESTFQSEVDSLAYQLSKLFASKGKSQEYYKECLVKWYDWGKDIRTKYNTLKDSVDDVSDVIKLFPYSFSNPMLAKGISYDELNALKTFHIFKDPSFYIAGFIPVKIYKRKKPFNNLADRTIGDVKKMDTSDQNKVEVGYVGLENGFDNYLKGKIGFGISKKIAKGVWRPIEDEKIIEAQNGYDVITTLDPNLQDIVTTTLKNKLHETRADSGCAILMEVNTGKIKAIANLGMGRDSSYSERLRNFAYGVISDPGSTFKLVSLMAAMEYNPNLTTNSTFLVDPGSSRVGNVVVTDDDNHSASIARNMTVREIFEQSSNIGTAKVVYGIFSKNAQAFVQKLRDFKLDTEVKLGIKGEGKPRIQFKKITKETANHLPNMSFGYSNEFTPLQILRFYNGVANNGKLINPYLVKEIRYLGKTIESFDSKVLVEKMCSERTLNFAKEMLEGVVERGTAKAIKTAGISIAGKTGTTQMLAVNRPGYDGSKHRASFCGYFPSKKPRYSCIVVVYNPKGTHYYGGDVAAPVFRDIAAKVYANTLNYEYQEIKQTKSTPLLTFKKTKRQDFQTVLTKLGIRSTFGSGKDYVSGQINNDTLRFSGSNVSGKKVPNFIGMGASDAIYLADKCKLKAIVRGFGKVISQSIDAGASIQSPSTIILNLQ